MTTNIHSLKKQQQQQQQIKPKKQTTKFELKYLKQVFKEGL